VNFGPVTLRPRDGEWWALNKRETGWASFGYRFPFLGDALDEFGLALTDCGVDQHGLFLIGETRSTAEEERVVRCLTGVPS
jgi:hypothetical protein